MQRRFLTLAAAALLLPLVAACDDESPLLSGDDFFPGGRPVTVQATLPASEFFELLGTFAGYPRGVTSPVFLLVADDFEGLDANSLLRFSFPERVQYGSGSDSLYTVSGGRLVAGIDSLASSVPATGSVTFRLWEVAQDYNPPSATWTLAVDTGAVTVPWQEPGGTRGALLAEGSWDPSLPGDSIFFPLDSVLVRRLRGDEIPGLMVTVETGRRVQLSRFTLRTDARPASRDTVVALNLSEGSQLYVYNPEQPRSGAALEVGGVASARTLFRLNLDRTVPACANPQANPACPRVPLRDVVLNGVDLILRPRSVPQGFAPLDSVPLAVRRISEPELGRAAPLGERVPGAVAFLAPSDTMVSVPLTVFARQAVATDSLSGTFALLSEPEAATFGVAWFEPDPRLRVTYTLPAATRLP